MFSGDPGTGGFLSEPRYVMANTGVCGLRRMVPLGTDLCPRLPSAASCFHTCGDVGLRKKPFPRS